MDSTVSTSLWRVGGASPPAVDIAVPYADEKRNRVLLSEWRRQAGESLPAPPLSLPRYSEGTYRVRIHAQKLLDIPVEDQYSDAVAGGTGGPDGHHGDLIVTHIVLSGEWRFTSRNTRSRAAAGTLCVRRNEEPWDMEAVRGTRAVAVGLPASAIRFPSNTLAITAEQTSPAARLLLAQLRLFAEVADELRPAQATAARNATLELFQGLVNDQVMDDADFTPALLEAATGYIEDRLLDDPDLNARAIAEALHVSVRTLYRVFAQEATSSVMAYVRERRLERARAELVSTRLTVSEVAARWHFADGSHFVKAYKKHFGETPTAVRRR
ncbi:helix-turn-helix transcriptional regulator [Streptomyces cavernae]|uniref:helix-turn-helix transcriptional regulator n=1 Tax=Streptomyces cavernae TaxID=2259034 RepID=UPI000FEC16DF|nr:AraC family transcriptional regulator [Streptomyces cavernae]